MGTSANQEPSSNLPAALSKTSQAADISNVDMAVSLGSPSTAGGIESTPVLLSLKPPRGSGRMPTDIICVIDASYSMQNQATVQNEKGVAEATGLTVLDVTKHAVRTVFNVLEPSDRLSLVTFADDGRIDMDLTAMDADGLAKAEKCTEKIACRGGTNIWAGVEKGLEVADAARRAAVTSASDRNRLIHVLVLTDGEPTVNPPKGKGTECEHLREYKEQQGWQLPCTLTTFGFGYSLKSKMLNELAEIGSGSYAFIPDSGFVGTVFVNAISNLLATMAQSAVLCLEPLGDARFTVEPVLGGHLATVSADKKLEVNVGTLQFGQNKDIVVRMHFGENASPRRASVPDKKMPFGRYKERRESAPATTDAAAENLRKNAPYLSATLCYRARNTDGDPQVCTTKLEATERTLSAEVEVQCNRLNAASSISQALNSALNDGVGVEHKLAQAVISDVVSVIRASSSANDERTEALLADLDGQVCEALSRDDYFQKWGQHYLPSLRLAHLHQQCNNFKDPGVQLYAGDFFSQIRDTADDMFNKLPPPKPSKSTSVAAPRDMSMFYNVGGGCFDGECLVLMADGSKKPLNQVVQGDRVMTPTGTSEVSCVVKTVCTGGCTELVELSGGLLATPWHPVRVAGVWRFPCELAVGVLRTCPAVFNLVLQGKHPSMLISGVECSVLGHGLDDPVAAHEFFGSNRILEDLRRMPGWESGLVELLPQNYIRDPITGRVCGLGVETVDCKLALPCRSELSNIVSQAKEAERMCVR